MIKFLLTAVTLLFLLGCAGVQRGQQAVHGHVSIYKGQSADSVERQLGPPNAVSSGIFCLNARSLPFGITPGASTIEWVYFAPVYSTIIYLDGGRVAYVHQIETSKVRWY